MGGSRPEGLNTCDQAPPPPSPEYKETTPASGEEGLWSMGAPGAPIMPGLRAGLHT